MRWWQPKKVVLLGTALLTIGVAGRAAAEESPRHHPRAAPVAQPAPSHSRPARPHSRPASPRTGSAHSARTGRSAALSAPSPNSPSTAAPSTAAPSPAGAAPPPGLPLAGKKTGGPAGSHLSTGTRAVALTFDDGPDPAETPRMLRLLAQQHVHATFCLVGQNVRRHPELVRQIVAGGNTLCNHTWKHSLTLGRQSAAAIRADLERTNSAIRQAAPGAEIKYFRAPGGNFTPRLVAAARSMGMTSLYWKVDPRDWDHPKGESDAAHRSRVIRTVEKRVRTGAIILSHDYAQPDTIAAYRTLIPWLRHRYQLIALPV